MYINWGERLSQTPTLRDWSTWPRVSMDMVPKEKQPAFLRNSEIAIKVLAGDNLREVAQIHNLTKGRISQLMNRCLGGDSAEPPALTKGLIPNVVLGQPARGPALPTLFRVSGARCAFRALLTRVPKLREGLDDFLLAKLKDRNYAQTPSPQRFHAEFKRLLADVNWPTDTYPYTHKSLAYESVRRYFHQRREELDQQNRRSKVSISLPLSPTSRRAQRQTQIDEHLLDVHIGIQLELNDELIPLRLGRPSVLLAIDVDTSCILGYQLTLTRHPNEDDFLLLLDSCLKPWLPEILTTPGLEYTPGASFPGGLDDAFPISFGEILLDNAWIHSARSVVQFLCEQHGASVTYGAPGNPKTRHAVESVFHYINQHLSHRFSSTTGSHPKDPIKESAKNSKAQPALGLRTLNEALSVVLTQFNATPKAHLGGASPLQMFAHHCANHYVRYTSASIAWTTRPLVGEKTVPVRRKDGSPYINFCYRQYTGDCLHKVGSPEHDIIIRYDRTDIRHLDAFSQKGDYLGKLNAPHSWQRYPHSSSTRKLIVNRCRDATRNSKDPLTDYFSSLLKNRGNPSTNLELIKVYQEFTRGQAGPISLRPEDDSGSDARPISFPSWRPELADHHG